MKTPRDPASIEWTSSETLLKEFPIDGAKAYSTYQIQFPFELADGRTDIWSRPLDLWIDADENTFMWVIEESETSKGEFELHALATVNNKIIIIHTEPVPMETIDKWVDEQDMVRSHKQTKEGLQMENLVPIELTEDGDE